jgi:hypothetical protein
MKSKQKMQKNRLKIQKNLLNFLSLNLGTGNHDIIR